MYLASDIIKLLAIRVTGEIALAVGSASRTLARAIGRFRRRRNNCRTISLKLPGFKLITGQVGADPSVISVVAPARPNALLKLGKILAPLSRRHVGEFLTAYG